MLTVYLFCVLIAVVAANPLFQRLPIQFSPRPSQACSVCPSQPCGNQILPPCQTCQNPLRNVYSSVPVVNQPSNNCPCNQPATIQNQVTNPPVDQEIIKQLMLSRLLGPQLQMLLNSNRGCNQCEQKASVPNIINNYIIIPPEYLKTNATNSYKDNSINNKRRYRGSRKQQRQMVQDEEHDNIESVIENDDEFLSNGNPDDNESSRGQGDRPRSSERPRKQEKDVSECSTETKEESECNLCDENNASKAANEPVKGENFKSKIAEESGKSMRQVLLENISKLMNAKPEIVSNKNPVTENSNGTPARKNKVNRAKNVEEAIIKGFCAKHPTIPEEIVKTLLATLKLQALSERSQPQQPIPFGHGQYLPIMLNPTYSTTTPRNRRQRDKRPSPVANRAERRNKNKVDRQDKNEECDHCETVIELNPTLFNIETETITTEKITAAENHVNNDGSKKNTDIQTETPRDFINKAETIKDKLLTKINEIETTTVKYNKIETFPELGKEDKIPAFYENGVEDYYPDFRDIEYCGSDEEPDRYRYTTVRNGVTGSKGNERRYVNVNKDNLRKLNESPKNYEGSKEPLTDKSIEVTFQSPPLLELPDFLTRQIKYASQEINDKFVADNFDKTSVHSDAKSDTRIPENDLTPVKVFSKDKKGRTSIETVYGHSKVVKYGPDVEGASSEPVITYYLPEEAMTEERIQLPDGEHSVVVTKSIRNLEEIWD